LDWPKPSSKSPIRAAAAFEAMQQYWGAAPHPTLSGIGVTWLYGFKFEIKVVAKLAIARRARGC
jgi:hypothetical protein